MHNILVAAEHLLPGDCWTEDCHEDESVFYVVYQTEKYGAHTVHVRLIAYKNGNSRQTVLKTSTTTRLVVDRPE